MNRPNEGSYFFWRPGLRTRLFLVFGMLVIALSFFSGAIYLNVTRASMEVISEQKSRQQAELLLQGNTLGQKALELAGFQRFAWRTDGSPWKGDGDHEWRVGPAPSRHTFAKLRWFGRLPSRMQLAGRYDDTEWRAEVPLENEAEILVKSSTGLLYYLILNTIVILGVGLLWLSIAVVRPLRRLAYAVDQAQGSATKFNPPPARRNDEIGTLTLALNDLMARIRSAEERSTKYVKELEEAYLQLEAAQEKLLTSEKLASLGRLSAGIAHEIGNPLSAVQGYFQLLVNEEDPERREIAERGLLETKRIDQIIRSLLTLASSRSSSESVEADYFMRDISEKLRSQILFREIEIRDEIDSPLPRIPTGEGRLEQVVINLAINAADAMGGKGTLTLRAKQEGDQRVRIDVSDTGHGISPDDLPHVFEPFYTTKPPGKGTGLGLAISHQILAALHGAIEVKSEPGNTIFTILLPTTE